MIVQSLVMAFILAFGAIAIYGHLLLVRAVFTPGKDRNRIDEASRSTRAPLAGARIAA
jgi:hypothetical protein